MHVVTSRQFNRQNSGFTLIELSIVLVIIGLVVGGVLAGKDLIAAAELRSQISQIQKYNTAANTFKIKYDNYLPGDLPSAQSTALGFTTRGTLSGQGDGNGFLEGRTDFPTGDTCGYYLSGENTLFWMDLSSANLIDGGFNTDTPSIAAGYTTIAADQLVSYVPRAKIGSNFVSVGSSYCTDFPNDIPAGVANYFGISVVNSTDGGRRPLANPGLSVSQAFNIDTKMDDGLPQSGSITAMYWTKEGGQGTMFYWASSDASQDFPTVWGAEGSHDYVTTWSYWQENSTIAASSTSCFHGAPYSRIYTMSVNEGAGINCALMFKMQ